MAHGWDANNNKKEATGLHTLDIMGIASIRFPHSALLSSVRWLYTADAMTSSERGNPVPRS